jgi:hypothetical protein
VVRARRSRLKNMARSKPMRKPRVRPPRISCHPSGIPSSRRPGQLRRGRRKAAKPLRLCLRLLRLERVARRALGPRRGPFGAVPPRGRRGIWRTRRRSASRFVRWIPRRVPRSREPSRR